MIRTDDVYGTNPLGARRAALAAICAIGALVPTPAWAQDDPAEPNPPTAQPTALPETAVEEVIRVRPIAVIGSKDNEWTLPGSGRYIGPEVIRDHTYDDVNRILQRVPGVYLRGEDGFGLFPNISLRGVDTGRSAKVTIMEDGVLMAPAPYAAPSAYYSPAAGRMHAIEVLKGSSQVRFGPHTTGGVVNYISTPVPETDRGYAKAIAGTDGETRLHGYWGTTVQTGIGRVGFLVEGFRRKSDGFKTIDRAPDFDDTEDTGFERTERTIKLSWQPGTSTHHRFEVKWGDSDLDANETYLGLTEADFGDDPYRRYAATRFDNITTEQERYQLRYWIQLADWVDLTVTAYRTEFDRDWFKLQDLRNAAGTRVSLSRALTSPSHIATLRGEAAGELRVRHNARSYRARGYEAVANFDFELGETTHTATTGLRLHRDQVRRFQRDEIFTQAANGAITARDPGTPGDAGNRRQRVRSLAWFAQDRIEVGDFSVTPGIRTERLGLDHDDFDDPTTRGRDHLTLGAWGLGITHTPTDSWTFFGGVHQGFSPPSPRASVKNGLDEETSRSFELGARHRSPDSPLRATATLFRTDFEDLIVVDNIGGSGSGSSENVGEIRTQGVELSIEYDTAFESESAWSNPWFLTATYTDAKLTGDSSSTDVASIFSGGKDGADVPYVPDWTFTVGTGIEKGKFSASVTGTYVADTFATASNTSEQVAPDGAGDARFGKTDSYFVVDLAVRYQIRDQVALVGGVHNLFDTEYLVSRQPHGPRPGKPRFAFLGLEVEF